MHVYTYAQLRGDSAYVFDTYVNSAYISNLWAYIYVYIYTNTCICIHVFIHIHTYVHTHTHKGIRILYVYAHKNAYVYVLYTLYLCTNTLTLTHKCTYILIHMRAAICLVYLTCMYLLFRIRKYAHIWIHWCTDTYTCIYLCTLTYVCTHAFMHLLYTHVHCDSPASHTITPLFQTMGSAMFMYVYMCMDLYMCHAYMYLRLHMCTATRLRAMLSCYSFRHHGCCYCVDTCVCIHVSGFIYIHTHIFTYTHEHSDSPSSNTVMLLFQTMGAAISGAPGILHIFLCVWSGTDLSVGGRLDGDACLLQCVAVCCSVLQCVAMYRWLVSVGVWCQCRVSCGCECIFMFPGTYAFTWIHP